MNTSPSRSPHLVLLLLLLTTGIGIGLWWNQSSMNDRQVKETVVTTIQQEADTSVFISGYLEISTHVTLQDTRHFPTTEDIPWYALPAFRLAGSPQVNLGTTRTTLWVPGRISYGFDISQLSPDDVKITDEEHVFIRLPALEIYSAEPYLDRLRVETDLGWARWSSSGRQLEYEALTNIRSAMQRQGHRHLQDSSHPHGQTVRALENVLGPALKAAGISNPTFEFYTRTTIPSRISS